jgi:hypothetical protein
VGERHLRNRYINQEHDTYHLISENAIEAVVVERYHPVQTLQLVPAHCAIYN